jgi:threonine dehydratase
METTMKEMLTLEAFEEASEVVKKVTAGTKLVSSSYFSAQSGNKVYLKPEKVYLTLPFKLQKIKNKK